MNVEISDQVTRQIEAILAQSGRTEVASSISRIVERVAADDQLLLSLLLEEPTAPELAQSLELIDRSMEEVAAGQTEPMKEALREIAAKYKLKIDR
ncbi:hypothetical protein [Lignipirellula cremea]|uniref:Uncharacterized protein n=1 Tax=Lignipirellula cremea TaxID=2528010 RepID=A0A518E3G8_9BACT|nr:hypothetical protein [Lignipirellula cremea]QDU98593.1 hypothetical protein Pla8534_64640 [Lignipirellula cremea]